MRVVLQRVSQARLSVAGEEAASIGPGLVAYVGFSSQDSIESMTYILNKIWNLRVFEDENGKLNRSVIDMGYEILFVPNFTLYGDCRSGRRPSYSSGAPVEEARKLFEQFQGEASHGPFRAAFGVFQAEMEISQSCDGPVTLLLDSQKVF